MATLHTMFRQESTPCLSTVCLAADNGRMHPSILRLLDYARRKVRASIDPSDIQKQLGVSVAVMTNWKNRGISKEGAIKAEQVFGCSVSWVMHGSGAEDSASAGNLQEAMHDPIRQGIGLRLESARQSARLSIEAVADRLQTDTAMVAAWESGRIPPDAVRLRELAKLYDVSADSLLWEDSLSPEAMKFAAAFDELNDQQRRTLNAIWMAYVQESIPDAAVEIAMPVTSKAPMNMGPIPDARVRKNDTLVSQFVDLDTVAHTKHLQLSIPGTGKKGAKDDERGSNSGNGPSGSGKHAAGPTPPSRTRKT